MNVLVVEPGTAPYEREINGLHEMQDTVGGLITAIYPYPEEVAIVCNDESILLGMEFNRSVPGGYGGLFGPFFICGIDKSDFCSLSPAQMERFKKEYYHAEILLGFHGGTRIAIHQIHPRLSGLHAGNHVQCHLRRIQKAFR